MMIQVKHKTGNTWRTTTEDLSALDQYKGKEVVAKISDAVMWCGTEQWRQYYIQQGYVATNSTELIEVAELAKQIFQSNREERIAIMEVEGTDADTINTTLANRPDLYGPQESLPASSTGQISEDREGPHQKQQLVKDGKGAGSRQAEKTEEARQQSMLGLW